MKNRNKLLKEIRSKYHIIHLSNDFVEKRHKILASGVAITENILYEKGTWIGVNKKTAFVDIYGVNIRNFIEHYLNSSASSYLYSGLIERNENKKALMIRRRLTNKILNNKINLIKN